MQSPQNLVGTCDWNIIALAISESRLCFLSTIPFCCEYLQKKFDEQCLFVYRMLLHVYLQTLGHCQTWWFELEC